MKNEHIELLLDTLKSINVNMELLGVFVAILVILVFFVIYKMMPNINKDYCVLTKEEVDEMIDYAFDYKYKEDKIIESREQAFKMALEYYNELLNKEEKK